MYLVILVYRIEFENRYKLYKNSIRFNIGFLGFDTSSKAMQYTLLELARNQELQEKTRNDIKTVLNKYDGKLTYEGLEEMTYLRQVMDGK